MVNVGMLEELSFQVQLGEIYVSTINQMWFWDASFGGDGAGPMCCFSSRPNGKDNNSAVEKEYVQGEKLA